MVSFSYDKLLVKTSIFEVIENQNSWRDHACNPNFHSREGCSLAKNQEITKIFFLGELQQSSSLPLFCSKHIQESEEHNKKSAKQCQSGRPTLKTYFRDKNISRNQKQHPTEKRPSFSESKAALIHNPVNWKHFQCSVQYYTYVSYPLLLTLPIKTISIFCLNTTTVKWYR